MAAVRSPVPSLLDLEAFEAAARHSSFAAAATELHLSPSAVSHRVRQLERHLGVLLFVRHARRIEPTDHARAYLPSVRKAFDELAMSTAGLFGPVRPAQRLIVRAPISYAVLVIAPTLHQFVESHRGIDVRLVSAIWADAVANDEVDVDVRFGLGAWPGQQAELLHREHAVVVRAPTPHAPETARPKVHVLGLEHLWADVPGGDNTGASVSTGDITVDTSLAAIELARSGRFRAIVPERFVRRHLASGELVHVGEPIMMRQAHYVMSSSAHRPASAAALLFVEWLRRLGTDAALDHVLTEVSEDQPIQAPTTSAFASTHAAAASPGAMP
ncbi:MAG: hypothetical protein RI958_1443 [Actinomycetota bacterium]